MDERAIDAKLRAHDDALFALVYVLVRRLPPQDVRSAYEELYQFSAAAALEGNAASARMLEDLARAVVAARREVFAN